LKIALAFVQTKLWGQAGLSRVSNLYLSLLQPPFRPVEHAAGPCPCHEPTCSCLLLRAPGPAAASSGRTTLMRPWDVCRWTSTSCPPMAVTYRPLGMYPFSLVLCPLSSSFCLVKAPKTVMFFFLCRDCIFALMQENLAGQKRANSPGL
jgi:hypothetical protein